MKRLEALSQQYGLPPAAPGQFRTILDALEAEHSSVTTVRDPKHAVDVHIADSLTGLEVSQVRTAARIADLGAGGGFPGLALAVALPAVTIDLVESVGRKGEFMTRAAAAAGLANARVVHSRAEEWEEGMGALDVVTARALAPLSVLLEYSSPLLILGGVLVAYKARRDDGEEADAARAAAVLEMELVQIVPVSPYPAAGERHLHVYRKAGPTPDRFPRRAGMARKRPL